MGAKKITRKNNAIRFNHVCFEENITVKTKNPCIGQADYEREECKKCVNARGNVALVCFCMSGLDKKVQKKKSGNSKVGKVGKSTEVKNFIISLAKKGKTTRREMGIVCRSTFPEYKKSSINTWISDSFNEKYFNKTGCGILLKKDKGIIKVA